MTKKRVRVERINDKFKNIPTEMENVRPSDDNRLPMSLMTYEEFKTATEIAERCIARMKKRREEREEAKKSGEPVKRMVPIPLSSPQHPSNELHEYLLLISKRLEGTPDEGRCIVCGEKIHKKEEDKGYPYCIYCSRRLRETGDIRGTNNTAGLKTYGKMCAVCEKAPAKPNHAGMCRSCYAWGTKIGVVDAQELHMLYEQNSGVRRTKNAKKKNEEKKVKGFIKKEWSL